MQNFYFTFGSDGRFPYGRDDYVLVQAENLPMACSAFKVVHPNRTGSNCLNCADFYTESSFQRMRETYYAGRDPAEIITLTLTVVKKAKGENK